MTVLSIDGLGAYAPRRYVTAETVREAWGYFAASGIERTAVPAADEDVLTMAYEASRLALDAADVPPARVSGLLLGTTTLPREDESACARVASFLGLAADTTTRQLSGSARVGVDAIALGLDASVDGDEAVLVVATDAPRGEPDSAVEHGAGAGAAAAVLTSVGEATVTDQAEYSAPYPGTRFRPAGERTSRSLGIKGYDRRAFREVVTGAVAGLERPPSVDAAAIGAPDGKLPYRVASGLGVDPETIQTGSTVHDVGDAGAATPLLGLARAIEDGADRVLVVGYGSGSEATAMVVRGPVPTAVALDGTDELSYAAYLRVRGTITPGEPEGSGAYVSVPSWRRTLPQRHRLVAGRCAACETLAFPPEGACTTCGALDSYEEVVLQGTGTVEATTVIGQGGAPPEFVEQQARSGGYASAVVAFDGPDGSSVGVPVQVVEWDDPPAIGDAVRATIRRVYTQEGVTRYGLKARPVLGQRRSV